MIMSAAFWAMALWGPHIAYSPAQKVPAAEEPKPATAPQLWVRNDDYPGEAVSRREQGTVRFVLDVDARGGVSGCAVTASSGSKLLDDTTCILLRQRATFIPAHDAEGKATAGRWSNRFNWELPAPDTPTELSGLPMSFGYEVILTLDVGGKITGCKVIREKGQSKGLCESFIAGEMMTPLPVQVKGQPTPVKLHLTVFNSYEAIDTK